MGYVGRGLNQEGGQYRKLDDISSGFNGSETSFTLKVSNLDVTPTAQNLLISINGVIQEPGSAFSMNGSTITFTEAPGSAASFFGVVMGEASFIAHDTVAANEMGVTAGTVKASRGVVVDTSSNVSGFNRITGTSGSFNYITASVIDTDASTIRVGGSPISKTLVDNLTTMTGSGTVQGTGTTDTTTFSSGTYTGDLGVSGSMTVKGTLTAQEFKTEFVSASIIFESGSTIFGDTSDDTHEVTGSMTISGSFNVDNGTSTVNALTAESVTTSGNISGSATSTGSFGMVGVGGLPSEANSRLGINGNIEMLSGSNRLFIPRASDGALTTSIFSRTGNNLTLSGAGSSGGQIEFIPSSANSSAVAMTIDSSGNVLVGKTSGTSGNLIETDGRISAGAGSTGQPTFNCEGDTNTGINLPESDRIQFITAGSEAVRIDSSQRVGIGITSPSAPLHISKDVTQVESAATSRTNAGFYLNANPTFGSNSLTMFEMSSSIATTATYGIQVGNSNAGSQYPLSLQPFGGNVGIGTGSPQALLDVGGSGAAAGDGASGGNFLFTRSVDTFQERPIVRINASDNISDNGGDISVGLNLQNLNSGNFHSPFIAFSGLSNSTSYVSTYAAIGAIKTGNGSDTNWNTGELMFYTAESASGGISLKERMRIKSNGNVAIGGTGAYQLLSVEGGDIYMSGGRKITWANGNAEIVESSYAFNFNTYNGSSVTTALTLSGNNIATFTGDIVRGNTDYTNRVYSGYGNGNQSWSVTVPIQDNSSLLITAMFSHYGAGINSYGATKMCWLACRDNSQSIHNIDEITSVSGGSWSIGTSSSTVTVTHQAGSYVGGGHWWVKMEGSANL